MKEFIYTLGFTSEGCISLPNAHREEMQRASMTTKTSRKYWIFDQKEIM